MEVLDTDVLDLVRHATHRLGHDVLDQVVGADEHDGTEDEHQKHAPHTANVALEPPEGLLPHAHHGIVVLLAVGVLEGVESLCLHLEPWIVLEKVLDPHDRQVDQVADLEGALERCNVFVV